MTQDGIILCRASLKRRNAGATSIRHSDHVPMKYGFMVSHTYRGGGGKLRYASVARRYYTSDLRPYLFDRVSLSRWPCHVTTQRD